MGAKTVKGPAPFKVSTRLAASNAVTNVENEPSVFAVSTMSVGSVVHHQYAPPEITITATTATTIIVDVFIFISKYSQLKPLHKLDVYTARHCTQMQTVNIIYIVNC